MKRRNKILWSMLIGILSIPILVYLVRPYSNLLLIFFTPADLYEPRILEPITLKEKKVLFELPLKHDYVGSYFVGVYLEQTPPFGTPVKSNAALTLKIKIDESTLLEEYYDNWEEVFWGGEERSGVILGSYKVPDHIPLKLNTRATLTVTSPDPSFDIRYGKLKFFIKRYLNE